MSYPLYHTLNKNLKTSDLKPSQKKLLIEKMNDLDFEKKKAVIMLIVEHSKTVDNANINPEDVILPYNMKDADGNTHIDLEELPIPLKWILWKFMNLPVNV